MRVTVQEAIFLLLAGKNVAIPTETVYGLAGVLNNPSAIEAIFNLKGRPSDNPLIIHVGSEEQVSTFTAALPPEFDSLVEAFWPGPLTLVVPIIEERVSTKIRGGLMTAAFRMPSHVLALQVLEKSGPLAMPSANLSGRPSPTSPEHVENDFGIDFPVVDGGVCDAGVESTVLNYQEGYWTVIRLGALEPKSFFEVLGYVPLVVNSGKEGLIQCPGQHYKHYSPKAKLKLVKEIPSDATGVVVGFIDKEYPPGVRLLSLGSKDDPQAVAHNLYMILRQLDSEGIIEALVDFDMPQDGLWLTISERFKKAADI